MPYSYYSADEDAVLIAMWEQGHRTSEIGATINRTKGSVISRANRLGLERHVYALSAGPKPRIMPHYVAKKLAPDAESRGITPGELAFRLLKTIACEPDLINAVLDDGHG